MRKIFAAFLPLGLMLSGFATEALAESRYTFEKTDKNILRFDNQTGQIDKCMVENDAVKCALSTDDRLALEKQIADLKARIAELETGKNEKPPLSKEEVDHAFDMMKYLMNKFQGLMKDEENGQTMTPAPQRL